jgi:hypothetical protein
MTDACYPILPVFRSSFFIPIYPKYHKSRIRATPPVESISGFFRFSVSGTAPRRL